MNQVRKAHSPKFALLLLGVLRPVGHSGDFQGLAMIKLFFGYPRVGQIGFAKICIFEDSPALG